MATIAEIRAQYPQYQDMSDRQLADALYAKSYSDMPRADFDRKIGMSAEAPTNLKPGSREYADWAAQEARSGRSLPQVSAPQPEWTPPTAKSTYEQSLANIRKTYYPELSDEQWQKAMDAKGFLGESMTNLKPHESMGLLNDGLTMGLSDEARGAAGAVSALFSGKDPGKAFQDYQQFEQSRREYGAEQSGALGTAAQIGGAVLAGRPDTAVTKTVGLLPSIIQGGKQAAQQGAVYGFASTEGDLGARAKGAATAALTGGFIGAAVPAVVGGVKKLVSPFGGSVTKRPAANVLAKEGVELTAGQATGNQNLRYREAELGGGAAEAFMEKQADQFTAAALKRVDVNATRATPDVIDDAFDAIGKQFDDLAAMTNTPLDLPLQDDLLRIAADYVDNAGTPAPVVERMMNRLDELARARNGRITGDTYQEIRSTLGRLSKSAEPTTAAALRDLQTALDDAVERHLSGKTLKAWQEARRLYRNMFVIQDAATRAGAASAEGIITPQALRGAAINQGKRAFARGRNDFAELANAGVSAMTPLPNSGTAGRLSAKSFVPWGAGAGATIGGAVGGLPGAAVGAAAGAVLPKLTGRLMLSGPGRAYLGNQAAGPVTSMAGQVGGLLGRGVQPLIPPGGR